MNKWKKYIPDGMKDILFEECKTKVEIEDKFRKLYLEEGFEEVISPTIEFYDVFNGPNQPMEQEKMYKLFDVQGRILVLRPDMTTPIARIAATKLKDHPLPLKLCYSANIFRINENLNGKINEITQSGIEIIGCESLKADVEAIMIGIKALLAAGLKNFKIELGQAEFFKGITENLELTEDEIEKARKLIENKNFAGLKNFIEDNEGKINQDAQRVLMELPNLFGGIEVINAAKSLTKNEAALKALDNIQQVYFTLERLELNEYISIDLGLVQHINYYTGIIFKGYSSDFGSNILSGGRYDGLVEQFGEMLPATGLALNTDNILQALKKQAISKTTNKNKFLVHYVEKNIEFAFNMAEKLRENGYEVEISLFDSSEMAAVYAERKNKDYFIYFNSDKVILKGLKKYVNKELELELSVESLYKNVEELL